MEGAAHTESPCQIYGCGKCSSKQVTTGQSLKRYVWSLHQCVFTGEK